MPVQPPTVRQTVWHTQINICKINYLGTCVILVWLARLSPLIVLVIRWDGLAVYVHSQPRSQLQNKRHKAFDIVHKYYRVILCRK